MQNPYQIFIILLILSNSYNIFARWINRDVFEKIFTDIAKNVHDTSLLMINAPSESTLYDRKPEKRILLDVSGAQKED